MQFICRNWLYKLYTRLACIWCAINAWSKKKIIIIYIYIYIYIYVYYIYLFFVLNNLSTWWQHLPRPLFHSNFSQKMTSKVEKKVHLPTHWSPYHVYLFSSKAWNRQDIGISKTVKDTSMFPSKIRWMHLRRQEVKLTLHSRIDAFLPWKAICFSHVSHRQ